MIKVRLIRKKFLYRLVVLLLAVFVLYHVYHMLVDRLLLPVTRSQLENLTGTEVTIGDISFHPNGHASIKHLKIASCLDSSGKMPFLTAAKVEAVMSLGSILKFKPKVKSITVQEFVADVTYNSDLSEWNLPALGFEGAGDSGGGVPVIRLNNGAIRLRRLSGDESENIYTVGLQKGVIAPAAKGSRCGFFFETNPSYSSGPSVIGGEWVRGRKGSITVKSENFSTGKVPILGNVLDTRKLELEIEYSPDELAIKKLSWLMGKDSSVAISGTIKDYRRTGQYDLQVSVRNTHLSRNPMVNAFVYGDGLDDFAGEGLGKFLDLYNPNGIGDLDLKAAGSLSDLSSSKLSGMAICKDISINYQKFPYKLEHITGKIKLSEKEIEIGKLHARHDDVDLEISGRATLSRENSSYDLNITSPNIMLGDDIYWALAKNQQSLWYTFTPRGRARLKYRVWRNAGRERNSLLVVDMLNAEADYLHFPYHLENVTGRVIIAPDKVEFLNLVSNYKDRKITLNGTVTDTRSGRPKYNILINAKNIPIDSRLKAALPFSQRSFYDSFQIDARTDAEIKVFPNMVGKRTVEYIAKVSIKDASLVYEDFPLPLSKVNVYAELTPDGTFLKELKGKNGDGEVVIEGTVWPADAENGEPGFCLSLSAQKIEVDGEWLKSLPSDAYDILSQLEPAGAINVRANMNRQSRTVCPEFSIAVECLGTRLKIPKLAYSVDNVFGTVIVEKDKVILEDIRANGASGDGFEEKVSLNGTILTENQQIVRGEFALVANDLPMDEKLGKAFELINSDFYEKVSPSGRFDVNLRKAIFYNDPEFGKHIEYAGDVTLKNCSYSGGNTVSGLFARVNSEGVYGIGTGLQECEAFLHSPSMKIKNREVRNLHCKIDYDPNTATLSSSEFTADCYGGKILGNMTVKRIQPKKFEYLLESYFFNVDLNGIVAAGREPSKSMEYTKGSAGGYFGVSGIFGDESSRIGRLSLEVSKMEFAKRSFFGKVITASQFSDPSDYIFSDLSAKSYIQKNNLFFENIELFGSSMQLKGQGNANLKNGKLAISFSGYGRKTRSEPSFLETLTRSLGSAVVNTEVTGTMDNPVIKTTTLPMIQKPFEILGTKD